MMAFKTMINLLPSNISIRHDLRGPILCPTMACATGLNAIGEGFKQIKHDEADVMICGGSDTGINPLQFHSMAK